VSLGVCQALSIGCMVELKPVGTFQHSEHNSNGTFSSGRGVRGVGILSCEDGGGG
jgi:hypothetical protein